MSAAVEHPGKAEAAQHAHGHHPHDAAVAHAHGKTEAEYRNYKDGLRQARVERFYATKYEKQTVEYAAKMKAHYGDFAHSPRPKMSVWAACEFLNSIVDESDPDNDLPQIHHCFQTAEACRRMCPGEDWFHLLGLIHDLGKVLASKPFGGLDQWETVGDTFPVGCAFTDANVLSQYFAANPDSKDPRYNTRLGMYTEHCGFDKVLWAFGHDEYLYMVLRNHAACTLPPPAMYCIRFHSFYPWHSKGGYGYLANETDASMLPWVQKFQKCDLYSKTEDRLDFAALATYYKALIEKYIPGELQW